MGYKDKAVKTQKQNEFISRSYDRVNVMLKKGTKAKLQVKAGEYDLSLNGYIKQAIKDRYEKDGGGNIDL